MSHGHCRFELRKLLVVGHQRCEVIERRRAFEEERGHNAQSVSVSHGA
jgi:hypothetical protein